MAISFDRAAEYYDQTRGYPPGVQERIGQAILAAADVSLTLARSKVVRRRRLPPMRILELGVGTGRIALPIIRTGYPYTGIDLSSQMLDKLRVALETIPGATERVTLVEGDIRNLPFAAASFDVVLSVHVYHLVADRARAIAETLRVLARPGTVLNCRDEFIDDPGRPLERKFISILRDLGYALPEEEPWRRTFYLSDEWRQLGGEVDTVAGPEWESFSTPTQAIIGVEQRQWAITWPVPEALYAEAVRQWRSWVDDHYGTVLDQPVRRRHRFLIERACFR